VILLLHETVHVDLIIIKNVIDTDNDGSDLTVKPSAFTIIVQGNNPLPRSFPGKSGEGVVVNLNPGRYSITEEGVNGYTADYSDGCQGTIRAGEAKACIITNEEAITPPSPVPPQPLPDIETITGFSAPYGIALNQDNDLVYVSNYGQFNTTGTISVINHTTNTIVANIPVGKNPQAIAYNPANGLFYVANTLSNTLSIINGTSSSLIGSIPVGDFPGKNPTGIVVNSINNTVYVTNMGSNTVSVINGTTTYLFHYMLTEFSGAPLKGVVNEAIATFIVQPYGPRTHVNWQYAMRPESDARLAKTFLRNSSKIANRDQEPELFRISIITYTHHQMPMRNLIQQEDQQCKEVILETEFIGGMGIPICGANLSTPVTDIAQYIKEIHYKIGNRLYIENAD
jgi:YVTN family beta-propeller protein